ncbi:MAG: tetratricopeptide repeat protein, partial [Myxococcota bacterium]
TQHSEGNPFFVAEYLRVAVEEELLTRNTQMGWQVPNGNTGYEPLPLPGSVVELVQRRIDGLAPTVRQVLEGAAVVGRQGGAQLLRQMTEQQEETFLTALQLLIRRCILEERQDGSWRFAHDTLREVAYAQLGRASRTQWHRRAALAIEACVTDRRPHLAALARHWDEAQQIDQARTYHLAAARQATHQYAFAQADELYTRWLALTPDTQPDRLHVELEYIQTVTFHVGDYPACHHAYTRLLDQARVQENAQAEAACLHGLGKTLTVLGPIDHAQTLLEQALACTRALGDTSAAALVLESLGGALWRLSKRDQALEIYRNALALHRQEGNRTHEAITLSSMAGIHYARSELERSRELCRQALVGHREVGDRCWEGITLSRMADIAFSKGDLAEARILYERALELHHAISNRRGQGISYSNLSSVYLRLGMLDESVAAVQRGGRVLRELSDAVGSGRALLMEGNIRQIQGFPERAHALYTDAIAQFRALDQPLSLAEALIGLAALARRFNGDNVLAQTHLEEAAAFIELTHDDFLAILYHCEQAHRALSQGHTPPMGLEAIEARARHTQQEDLEIVEALDRLTRAVRAVHAGEPLWRGEAWDALPEGIKRWGETHSTEDLRRS